MTSVAKPRVSPRPVNVHASVATGGNEGMEQLIKLVNQLQDNFNANGIGFSFDLPQIAVIGSQSAGKSSVLEGFVGRDFLPRGSGIVTRRPLLLQLIHNKDGEEYGVFDHQPGRQFLNFDEIRDEIVAETDRETGSNKGISSRPINLKIYSPNVLNLTLIDLPGITRVAIGDQPPDIEQKIRSMILQFISKENCLILAVTAATQDLTTSDALKLAKEVDPEGNRSIGVITKIDLMDQGTNAQDILENRILPLKRGYIGIVNRSQRDIDSKKNIANALESERQFFISRTEYCHMANRLGSKFLQEHLNKELAKHIYQNIPDLKTKLKDRLDYFQGLISSIDTKCIKPTDESLLETLKDVSDKFEASIGRTGTFDVDTRNLSGGARIKRFLHNQFSDQINELSFKPAELRTEIAMVIENVHGIYSGIFPPDMAFEVVLKKQIERFRDPSLRSVEKVAEELESMGKGSTASLTMFPRLQDAIAEAIRVKVIETEKEAKQRIDFHVDVQSSYTYTGHKGFRMHDTTEVSRPAPAAPTIQNKRGTISVKLNNKRTQSAVEKWFVLSRGTLSLYNDANERERFVFIQLDGVHITLNPTNRNSIILIHQSRNIFMDGRTMELICNSPAELQDFIPHLQKCGVTYSNNNSINTNNTNTSSNSTWFNDNDELNTDQVSLENSPVSSLDNQWPQTQKRLVNLKALNQNDGQIDAVYKMVESYTQIMKEEFKSYIPKLIMHVMINQIRKFLATNIHIIMKKYDLDELFTPGADDQVKLKEYKLKYKICQKSLDEVNNVASRVK